MTQSDDPSAGQASRRKIPRYDWLVLPAIGLLTIFLLQYFGERVARGVFYTVDEGMPKCEAFDSSTGYHQIPNSTCSEKVAESPLIQYRFNECGDRTSLKCEVKSPDSYRIVVTGSSFAIGSRVEESKTFDALLPERLSLASGRRVELYDKAFIYYSTPRYVASHMSEVLKAAPDLILYVVNPFDIKNVNVLSNPRRDMPWLSRSEKLKVVLHADDPAKAIMEQVRDRVKGGDPNLYFMLQHTLFESQSQYIKSYLEQDSVAGFLRTNLDAQWQDNLKEFDRHFGEMTSQAQTAGVPFAVVWVPNRAEAAMISAGHWPDGYNPYAVGNEIRSIVTSHGGTYIDILPYFRNIPNPEKHYYPIDGHPDAEGHAIITDLLVRGLTSGAIPALKASTPQQAALEQRK